MEPELKEVVRGGEGESGGVGEPIRFEWLRTEEQKDTCFIIFVVSVTILEIKLNKEDKE